MSLDAVKEDKHIADDLIDTPKAYEDECVGMAADMIGILKRIIVFNNDGNCVVMCNLKIIKFKGFYEEVQPAEAKKKEAAPVKAVRKANKEKYSGINLSYPQIRRKHCGFKTQKR